MKGVLAPAHYPGAAWRRFSIMPPATMGAATTMPADDALTAAAFIGRLTDRQLDQGFSGAKRTRIMARMGGVLALKSGLDDDAARREEL